METISRGAKQELVTALRERYRVGSKADKGRILSEFVAVSGYHRKHAVRLMRSVAARVPAEAVARERIYGQAVKEALTVIWETADRICGKRLKAVIPQLVAALEKHGHLALAEEVRKRVFSISAATIDRLLQPVRAGANQRRRRRSAKKVSQQIPIKTSHDWQDPLPGYLEIDFVVHGGASTAGEYLHSLVVTDVCSGWTEAVPLLAREQSLVVEGLRRIRQQMPVPVRGINSDNDSAFINDTLAAYCQTEGIVFTRSRAHHKNDQAWIEQKNGAVVRKIVGHERLAGIVAGQALAQLYQVVRLYVNYFQPSFKLRERVRENGRIKKLYHSPATPCDRLLAHAQVEEEAKGTLRTQREGLDPLELMQRMRQGQSALAALSARESCLASERQSLNEFLAALPKLWELGEVRPTHRPAPIKPRWWRSRADPFKEVWAEVLLWLQGEPDSTAKALFERLRERYPDRFQAGQLRTLQRRISEWRLMMARKLVLGGVEQYHAVEAVAESPSVT